MSNMELISADAANILIAMDSFKGSLTSDEAGNAVKDAITIIDPSVNAQVYTVADGGEGLTTAILNNREHEVRTIRVTGPLGNTVEAVYGIYRQDNVLCAVMEMAAAAGLTLVPEERRNPLYTTTYGVGEMILDALEAGCRKIIIGIGGSATNDAGIGMLQALGFHFLNQAAQEVSFGAEAVRDTVNIRKPVLDKWNSCEFYVACDVKNPLFGTNGCSKVFSIQKGATPELAEQMDIWMQQYSDTVKKQYPNADAYAEGAGAAGGLGFAFHTFLQAKLERGIEIVLRENEFENRIADADLVITGEGRLDEQTAMGKVPAGIAECAKKHGVRVLAFGGVVDTIALQSLVRAGIDACYAITPAEMPIGYAMQKEVAIDNLKRKVTEVICEEMKRDESGNQNERITVNTNER